VYNRGLTLAFASGARHEVALEAGRRVLPFGEVDVAMQPHELEWGGFELVHFASAAEYAGRGLNNRYRHPGLGAPLAASPGEPVGGARPPGSEHVPPRLRVPVTAFLRIEDPRAALASGELRAALELYSDDEGLATQVDGRTVPLEVERSSSLALALEGSPIYDFGLAGFRLGAFLPPGPAGRLLFLHPYRPGRLPPALVPGPFSTPATPA